MAKAKAQNPDNPSLVPTESSLGTLAAGKLAVIKPDDLTEAIDFAVKDTWPGIIPITRDELDVLETYLTALIDETLR